LLKETLDRLLYSTGYWGDSYSRDAKSALTEEIVTPEARRHDHAGGPVDVSGQTPIPGGER
jgi:hypothetical protein